MLRLHFWFTRVSMVTLLVAGCGAAQAQGVRERPVRTGETPPAQVAAGETADALELDEISVVATRRATQALDVPGNVSVISRGQLQRNIIQDNQDLVRYQPGITVGRQTSGTDPFGNVGTFTIRGVSGNRIQMQVDGTRVLERITDGNRNVVDLSLLKAVEIVRGPGSVLWGADAIGGIVAYRTLDPDDLLTDPRKPYALQIESAYDSLNNSFTKTGIAAFRFSPEWQGLLAFTHRSYNEATLGKARADGGRWGCPRVADAIRCDELNPLDADVWNGLGKLVWRPSADHQFRLTGEGFKSESTADQRYDFGRQTTGAFNGPYIREQEQSRYRISLDHEWDVKTRFLDQLKWQLSYSPQKRDVTSNRYQVLANGQQQTIYDETNYEEKFTQFDIQGTSSFGFLGASHTLTYGFQGDHTRTDYEKLTITRNLTTGGTTVARAGGFNFANATTTRADLFLQDEIRLFGDRLTVTPGVRWANYTIDPRTNADYKVSPGAEPRKLDSTRFVPQVGALFKLDDTYSVYARYAEGFKMPTAQQLYMSLPGTSFNLVPNPSLKPEKVRSYEGGLRGQFDGNRYFESAWFSVGAFYADYTDFIQTLVQAPGTTNDYTSRNLSSVNIWGIEASAEVQLTEQWALNGSVSWQRGEQKAEPGDPTTAYDDAIPLTGVLGVKWTKAEWGLGAEFTGTFAQGVKRTADPDTFRPGGYAVFDAFLNWSPKVKDWGWNGIESVTIRAGVQNIFDKRYFDWPLGYAFGNQPSPASQAAANPLELQTAPGRTFKVSAQVKF
jgi:hemoglobin/transferrin/lactoferrin receptor protein